MPRDLPKVQKITTNVTKVTVERVTVELDQETIEEILSEWLLSASKPFFAHSISFNWDGYDLPRVTVIGEKVS